MQIRYDCLCIALHHWTRGDAIAVHFTITFCVVCVCVCMNEFLVPLTFIILSVTSLDYGGRRLHTTDPLPEQPGPRLECLIQTYMFLRASLFRSELRVQRGGRARVARMGPRLSTDARVAAIRRRPSGGWRRRGRRWRTSDASRARGRGWNAELGVGRYGQAPRNMYVPIPFQSCTPYPVRAA